MTDDCCLDRPAMRVILDLARETLAQHDRLEERGWAVNSIPHEAEVRALLALPPERPEP